MAAINPHPPIAAYRHVAIYTRISKDKYGNAETCLDQETIGRTYAGKTWPGLPVVVYSDPDLSAFEDGVHRPGFEALKEAVAAGMVLHLWAVEQSRLERQEAPWFHLAALLDEAGIELLHTHRDGIVRVRDEVAGIKAVLAAAEVRKMKKRLADKFDAQAARGIPPGSRPYGYVHGRLDNGDRTYVIVPEQAEVIREAAGLVLNGWSLENIARQFRNRGLKGAHLAKVRDKSGNLVTDEDGRALTRPSEITAAAVRGMLTNRAVVGINVRRKVEVGDGNWTPILDKTTWRQVGARLSGTRTVRMVNGRDYVVGERHRGPGTTRKYLLTGGTGECGVCEAPLVESERQFRSKSRGAYTAPYLFCHPNTGGKGCVGIMGQPAEDFVVAELFDEIKRRQDDKLIDEGAVGARRDAITRELDDVSERRKDLAHLWAQRELNGEEWKEARAALNAEEARLKADLRALPSPVEDRDAAEIIADWATMTLDERRAVIKDYIEKVIVVRARPGFKQFDSGRVTIVWRRSLQGRSGGLL
ncbi:recombinase family protein [Hamadaea sp. NPDC050747]|uniref:recombinase family protein n=1 Tax=Hamadaea sp. NPDC050747 TaxID=3155789 RepID=UPI003400FBC1